MHFSKTWLNLLFILGMTLAGCASYPVSKPVPSPEWLYVQVPDSLLSLSEEFQACSPSGAGLALLSPVDTGTPQIILQWGEIQPGNYEAYEIGEEQLVFIVHPENPITKVHIEDIKKAYEGNFSSLNWQNLGGNDLSLALAGYAPESEITPLFRQSLNFQEQSFPREMVLVPSPQEMLKFIANTPGGLGFIPRRWADKSVRILPLEGTTNSLSFPMIALSATEPQGHAREWLLCLQKHLSALP